MSHPSLPQICRRKSVITLGILTKGKITRREEVFRQRSFPSVNPREGFR